MMLFKSCPKCSTGDLIEARDGFGRYIQCVQCGYQCVQCGYLKQCVQCGYLKDIPSFDGRRLEPDGHAVIARSA